MSHEDDTVYGHCPTDALAAGIIDLSDVTFTIPYRQDSDERQRNLAVILDFLQRHFKTHILVLESSEAPGPARGLVRAMGQSYVYLPALFSAFHRTRLLNLMAELCATPIIANYDVDVLFKVRQLAEAVNLLRQRRVSMVYPYGGRWVDLNGCELERACCERSVEWLSDDAGKSVNKRSLGGAVLWNRAAFFNFGMENQNFISWGYEDNERYERAVKLQVPVARVAGTAWHLHHPPSANSLNFRHPHYRANKREYRTVKKMGPDELRAYVRTWPWAHLNE